QCIAKSVVREGVGKKGAACRLYTVVFSAENFTSGGSEVSCLRKLFDAGVRIYHLGDRSGHSRLHAKILLLPNELVTIGSQNMTAGGMSNLEATGVWREARAAVEALAGVKGWMGAGKVGTETGVKKLETVVAQLRRQHRTWKNAARKVTGDIWTEWQEEEDRKRRAAAAAAEAAHKKPRRRGFVERCASQVIEGRVLPQGRYWTLSNKGQYRTPPSYCQWE